MALIHVGFFSQTIGMCMSCDVILPQRATRQIGMDSAATEGKHKVLWLLHGMSDDQTIWQRRTSIERYAAPLGLAVVMPAVSLSRYANMVHGRRYYDYVAQELPQIMRDMFPLSDRREDNFIAGLSMGGSGTLVYALNHPEKFAAAAVLSCCPFEAGFSNGDELNERSQGMIANRGGLQAYLDSYENTWGLCDKLAGDPSLPKFYFAIGKDDFLYQSYLHFKAHAKQIVFEAKFEEFDGFKHEWRFWDMTIQRALTFFGLDESGAGNPF